MPVGRKPIRGPVICDECGEQFKSLTALESHTRWLDVPEQDRVVHHSCPECGERFLRLSVMNHHRLEAHGVPEPVAGLGSREPILSCSECVFHAPSLPSLGSHVWRMHGRVLTRAERVPVDQATRDRLLASSRA